MNPSNSTRAGGELRRRRARPGGVMGCVFIIALFVVLDGAAPDRFDAP
jgi:hypothetical protein